MTMNPTNIIVEKEMIPSFSFPSESVNITNETRTALLKKLQRSMVLGNIHRTKMRIIFEDNEGRKEVRTTIWAVGDKNIVLKKGVIIPISRIIDII